MWALLPRTRALAMSKSPRLVVGNARDDTRAAEVHSCAQTETQMSLRLYALCLTSCWEQHELIRASTGRCKLGEV